MDSQWTAAAVAIAAVLGGSAINLFIIGRFVGQWSEALKNLSKTIERVEERVEEVGGHGEQVSGRVGLLDQRLIVAEQAASKFWEMRDEFTAMRVTVEIEGKHAREAWASTARGLAVVERQLGNLVSSRSGFTTLTTEDNNK